MSANESLLQRRQAAVARGVAHAVPVFAASAENATLTDADGRQYIDFASGISVLNVGHRHPRVIRAVEAQLQQVTHAAFQVTPYENYIALAERLNALAPGPTPKKTVLFTTGSEAVENALKLARFHTRRPGVIAFAGGFHGRSLGGLSLTGKVQPYKTGFGPFLPQVFHAPYPMTYHGIDGAQSLVAIAQLFKSDIDPSEVAAIVIEPVLGEGGFYVAPPEFLRALRTLCDEQGIVLIIDEVQSGFARTGRMFALEHAGVEADLMVVAKSLAGGLPLSGIIGRAAIMDGPAPGSLGGTYGGSPLGCAAALAVLDVIADEELCARALRLGSRLRQRLEAMQRADHGIGEVRGLGSMMAIELVRDADASKPDAERTRRVVQAAAARGLLLLGCGLYNNVLRILAPLTIPEGQLELGLDLLQAALADSA